MEKQETTNKNVEICEHQGKNPYAKPKIDDLNTKICSLLYDSPEKVNNANNKDNNREPFCILYSFREKGFKHILDKDTFLRVNEKCKNNGQFNFLIWNFLNLFRDLDDEIVEAILKKSVSGANMILLNIGSFGRIDIIKVLNKFSERNKFSINNNLYQKVFYSRDINIQSEFKETIIKNLVEAGYIEDLRESYNLENGGPLQKIGISREKLEEIVKGYQK